MNAPASITITPVHVAELLAEGELRPVYVYVFDHPDRRVLVDTGIDGAAPGGGGPRSPPPSTESSRTSTSPASTLSSTRTCTSTTAAATTSSPAGRSTSSVGARRRSQRGGVHHPRVGRRPRRRIRARRRRTRAASRGPASPGAGPHTAARSTSLSRPAGVRSSWAAMWRFGSASSTSHTPKASCWCAHRPRNGLARG